MRCIAKEQFERENRRYPLTNQKFYKNLFGSITFTGLSKKKWTPSLSFRHFFRSYLGLNVFTSCDVAQCGHNIRLSHSDDLFSQPKTKSVILCLPAEKETSYTSRWARRASRRNCFEFFPKFICSLIQFLQYKKGVQL